MTEKAQFAPSAPRILRSSLTKYSQAHDCKDAGVRATHAYRDIGVRVESGTETEDTKADAYREVGVRATQDAKAEQL